MIIKSTTVLAAIKDGRLAFASDGQVTMGDNIVKSKAKKIRKFTAHKVIAGFAGQTADAFTLFERFESRLDAASGNLTRAAVELAKDWRMDKALRQLQAMLLVGNTQQLLMLSGQGDIIEPDEPLASIGSGSVIALAAAKALYRNTSLSAEEIVESSMQISAEQCIYTNSHITLEVLQDQ